MEYLEDWGMPDDEPESESEPRVPVIQFPKPVRTQLEAPEAAEMDWVKEEGKRWIYRKAFPVEHKISELTHLFAPEFEAAGTPLTECLGCNKCARYVITVFSPDFSERIRAYTPAVMDPDEVIRGLTRLIKAETEDEWNWSMAHLEEVETPACQNMGGGGYEYPIGN